ncbi:MAG: response regulator [Dehalococcoidia bacterium]|nr:response regulator [Dehalococcoidia bacterium]MDD5647791.1 response regulator [Dehalococcoidia bacterium]
MSKRRILYIEDNEQNFYLVNVLLKTKDYQVLWAQDGREGIEKAEQLKPDLILLDIQLPVMDGYDVAKMLRSNPDLNKIPVIAVTSYAMSGDREKALSAGCNGYIEKPIDPDTFLAQIDKYLPRADSGGNTQ